MGGASYESKSSENDVGNFDEFGGGVLATPLDCPVVDVIV